LTSFPGSKVCEGIHVEYLNKCLQSLIQHTAQFTRRSNFARVRFEVEALNDPECGFSLSDYISDIDLRGIAGKGNASATARGRPYEGMRMQSLDHSHEMVSRDPVSLTDLLSRNETTSMLGEIEQYS
jgi:hypothetical protein